MGRENQKWSGKAILFQGVKNAASLSPHLPRLWIFHFYTFYHLWDSSSFISRKCIFDLTRFCTHHYIEHWKCHTVFRSSFSVFVLLLNTFRCCWFSDLSCNFCFHWVSSAPVKGLREQESHSPKALPSTFSSFVSSNSC